MHNTANANAPIELRQNMTNLHRDPNSGKAKHRHKVKRFNLQGWCEPEKASGC
jgi:hypothetical protein